MPREVLCSQQDQNNNKASKKGWGKFSNAKLKESGGIGEIFLELGINFWCTEKTEEGQNALCGFKKGRSSNQTLF